MTHNVAVETLHLEGERGYASYRFSIARQEPHALSINIAVSTDKGFIGDTLDTEGSRHLYETLKKVFEVEEEPEVVVDNPANRSFLQRLLTR